MPRAACYSHSDWQVDFNGDGRVDIEWPNTDGRTTNGLGTTNGSVTDPAPNARTGVDTYWHVMPQVDGVF